MQQIWHVYNLYLGTYLPIGTGRCDLKSIATDMACILKVLSDVIWKIYNQAVIYT